MLRSFLCVNTKEAGEVREGDNRHPPSYQHDLTTTTTRREVIHTTGTPLSPLRTETRKLTHNTKNKTIISFCSMPQLKTIRRIIKDATPRFSDVEDQSEH